MASVTVLSPGMLTTVQDSGRTGYQNYGMPVTGAMDQYAFQIANVLVGNPLDAACLEITITGPELIMNSSGAIAITGADTGPHLNGKPVPLWRTVIINKNDVLYFSGLKSGCRSYIAFAGGIDVFLIMGSRSTYFRV